VVPEPVRCLSCASSIGSHINRSQFLRKRPPIELVGTVSTRCAICALKECWVWNALGFHDPKCRRKYVLRKVSDAPGYRWCCEGVKRLISKSRYLEAFPDNAGAEKLRRRVNRVDYPKYLASRKWEGQLNRSMFAYTLRAWKWSAPPIGQLLTAGKGDSAAKMAAKRGIEMFVNTCHFPIPWSPEFLSNLCSIHQPEATNMSAATGGPLRLPREKGVDAEDPKQGRKSFRKRPTQFDSMSAHQLRELEHDHRSWALEQNRIADALAELASEKEATEQRRRIGSSSPKQ
jgi:hypothetical protein